MQERIPLRGLKPAEARLLSARLKVRAFRRKDKPNLSRTLKTMEQYGLVQIGRSKRKLVPRVRYQRVAVLMELSA